MQFEFDEAKSRANRQKHGIDFEEAQALWGDPDRVEVPVTHVEEPRWLVIGVIGGKHGSAAVTAREERVRIISVRRSRVEEVELYES